MKTTVTTRAQMVLNQMILRHNHYLTLHHPSTIRWLLQLHWLPLYSTQNTSRILTSQWILYVWYLLISIYSTISQNTEVLLNVITKETFMATLHEVTITYAQRYYCFPHPSMGRNLVCFLLCTHMPQNNEDHSISHSYHKLECSRPWSRRYFFLYIASSSLNVSNI